MRCRIDCARRLPEFSRVSAPAPLSAPARPALGLWTAIALVVGNMIGSGLFLLPSALASYGAAALLGWGISIVGALALAVVFARLGQRNPRRGGPYAFAHQAFGPAAGFVVAWSYWISTWCGNAAIAIAFAGYFGALVPATTSTPLRAAATALVALWVCTLANLAGVRSAGRVQLVTATLKLLPLAAIAFVGIWSIEPAALQPFNRSGGNPWSVAIATAALTLWAFLGLESATIPAEDVGNPRRTIPRATLIGTTIAACATLVACMVVVALVPEATLTTSSAPFADAAAQLWGAQAGSLFAAAAAIACFGALNGWVLVQGQVPLAAADDGVFPALFARRDANGTPVSGLAVGSLMATILIVANYQQSLVGLFTFSILVSTGATLVPYLFCSAAEWRLSSMDRTIGARDGRPLAGFAVLFSAAALLGTGLEALGWGAALLLAGVPVYLWQRRKAAQG